MGLPRPCVLQLYGGEVHDQVDALSGEVVAVVEGLQDWGVGEGTIEGQPVSVADVAAAS